MSEDESTASLIKKLSLTMSGQYHTPIDYWLNLKLEELSDWASTAKELHEAES